MRPFVSATMLGSFFKASMAAPSGDMLRGGGEEHRRSRPREAWSFALVGHIGPIVYGGDWPGVGRVAHFENGFTGHIYTLSFKVVSHEILPILKEPVSASPRKNGLGDVGSEPNLPDHPDWALGISFGASSTWSFSRLRYLARPATVRAISWAWVCFAASRGLRRESLSSVVSFFRSTWSLLSGSLPRSRPPWAVGIVTTGNHDSCFK